MGEISTSFPRTPVASITARASASESGLLVRYGIITASTFSGPKARAARALGCRTYFCDANTEGVLAEAHEHFLGRLREIERGTGYPAAYGRFPALLRARGVGAEESS